MLQSDSLATVSRPLIEQVGDDLGVPVNQSGHAREVEVRVVQVELPRYPRGQDNLWRPVCRQADHHAPTLRSFERISLIFAASLDFA